MPVRLTRFCAVVLGSVLLGAIACRSERKSVARIADAIPRNATGKTLLDVVRPLVVSPVTPRIELAPWTVSDADLGIGETAQALRFIQDSTVVAVVGHGGSRATLSVESLYRDAGMPVIVPTATARALRDVGPHVFMLAPTDDVIGGFLVDEATSRLGARRLGVIYVADAYGDGIYEGVNDRLKATGKTLVGSAALSGRECEFEGLAMDAVVKAFLLRSKPDAVIVALPQKAAWCAVRILAREVPTVTILTTDSFVLHTDWPLSAAERVNTHALVFWEPGTDSVSATFVSRARAILGRDPEPSQALEFDGFQLVAAAIREGHVTRKGVMTWLQQLGTPGHPAFQGITGPIDFKSPRRSVLKLKALGEQTPTS